MLKMLITFTRTKILKAVAAYEVSAIVFILFLLVGQCLHGSGKAKPAGNALGARCQVTIGTDSTQFDRDPTVRTTNTFTLRGQEYTLILPADPVTK